MFPEHYPISSVTPGDEQAATTITTQAAGATVYDWCITRQELSNLKEPSAFAGSSSLSNEPPSSNPLKTSIRLGVSA